MGVAVSYTSRIFKADQRMPVLAQHHQSYFIFPGNAGQRFGNPFFVSDVFVEAGKSVSYTFSKWHHYLVIPIVGGLNCRTSAERELAIDAQEVLFLSGRDGESYYIHNPYENETINFLHIAFRQHSPTDSSSLRLPFCLDRQNHSVSLGLEKMLPNAYGSAAFYRGRNKGCYKLRNNNNHLLAIVINGVFEVAERLLEHRDVLVVCGETEVNFESLSEAAILLFLEVPVS